MWRFSSHLALTKDLQSYLEVPFHPFQRENVRVVGNGVNPRNNLLEIEEGLRLERLGLV